MQGVRSAYGEQQDADSAGHGREVGRTREQESWRGAGLAPVAHLSRSRFSDREAGKVPA